jgi:hypothetical protein
MDDQPRLRLAGTDRLKNPVKRNDDKIDFVRGQLQPQLQRQKRARHRPRHGDFDWGKISPAERRFRHQHWPIAVAHARAAGQQRVFIAHIRIRVKADRRYIQFAARGPLIERLDVLQNMFKFKTAGRD